MQERRHLRRQSLLEIVELHATDEGLELLGTLDLLQPVEEQSPVAALEHISTFILLRVAFGKSMEQLLMAVDTPPEESILAHPIVQVISGR